MRAVLMWGEGDFNLDLHALQYNYSGELKTEYFPNVVCIFISKNFGATSFLQMRISQSRFSQIKISAKGKRQFIY